MIFNSKIIYNLIYISIVIHIHIDGQVTIKVINHKELILQKNNLMFFNISKLCFIITRIIIFCFSLFN